MKTLARFVYPSEQGVVAGTNILFNTNTYCTRYFDYNTDGSIRIKKPGTYTILANFDIMATSTGGQTIIMYENASPVAGAEGTITAATIGDIYNVAFHAVATVKTADSGQALLSFKALENMNLENANVIIMVS